VGAGLVVVGGVGGEKCRVECWLYGVGDDGLWGRSGGGVGGGGVVEGWGGGGGGALVPLASCILPPMLIQFET